MNIQDRAPWVIWRLKDNLDRWSRFHLFGTYFLVDVLLKNFWLGCGAAFIWETLDVSWYWETHNSRRAKNYWILTNLNSGMQPINKTMDEILDRRGFSWVDFILGVFASLVWFILNR